MQTRHAERSVSETALRSFDAPDLIEEPESELLPGERDPRDEPRGGFFREQRRLGYGITKGKPRPRYYKGTWPRRTRDETPGDAL